MKILICVVTPKEEPEVLEKHVIQMPSCPRMNERIIFKLLTYKVVSVLWTPDAKSQDVAIGVTYLRE